MPDRTDYKHLYDSGFWNRRRKLQLRFEPLCRMCLANGMVMQATVADHIEPHKGDVDKFYLGGLQSLCEPCHSQGKQRFEARGYVDDIDRDGWPIDPKHPANRSR
jgi:hypothetical protein